jgi:hypothetical protein
MPETAQDKHLIEKEIEQLNQQQEPACKAKWELKTGIRHLALRNLPGRRPQWRFSKKTGKLICNGKGGVNWYRYQKVCNSYIIYYLDYLLRGLLGSFGSKVNPIRKALYA